MVAGLFDFGMEGIFQSSQHFDDHAVIGTLAASFSMSDRVHADADLRDWEYFIVSGTEGSIFVAVLDENLTTFCIIVQPPPPADELVAAVQPYCRTLWHLLRTA